MKKKWIIIGILTVSLFLVGMVSTTVNDFSTDWWVMSGGGGSGTSGTTSMDFTMGQWMVGSGSSGGNLLESGFWPGIEAWIRIWLPIIMHQHP